MGLLHTLMHLDEHLKGLIQRHGGWAYVILFLIVFAETGLVVMPFLPGDSLLFTAGLLAAQKDSFDISIVVAVFVGAALCGDNVNYFLGCKLGRKLFRNEKSKFFNKAHLEKTHEFFEKHGGKTVIIARFLPIFRTFAPFVAGMGRMSYRKFMTYSVLAALLWVGLCTFMGYFLGRNAWVKANFTLVLLILVVVTAIPGIIEVLRHTRGSKKKSEAVKVEEPIAEEA